MGIVRKRLYHVTLVLVLLISVISFSSCKKTSSTEYTLKSPNGDVINMQLSLPSKWECNVDNDNKIFTVTNETGIEVFRGTVETKETYETYLGEVKNLNAVMTFTTINETDSTFFCNLKDEEWDYFQLIPDSNSGLVGGSATSQKDVETLIADLKLECTANGSDSFSSSGSSSSSSSSSTSSSTLSTSSTSSSSSADQSTGSTITGAGSSSGSVNVPIQGISQQTTPAQSNSSDPKVVSTSSNENVTFALGGAITRDQNELVIPVLVTNNTNYTLDVWDYEIDVDGTMWYNTFEYHLAAKQSGVFDLSFGTLQLKEYGVTEITEITAPGSRDCTLDSGTDRISDVEGSIVPRIALKFAEPISTGIGDQEILYDRDGVRVKRTIMCYPDYGDDPIPVESHLLVDNRNNFPVQIFTSNVRTQVEVQDHYEVTLEPNETSLDWPFMYTSAPYSDVTFDITVKNEFTGEIIATAKDLKVAYPTADNYT